MQPICRHVFDAHALVQQHPPVFFSAHKQLVNELASPPEARHAGKITFSRWATQPLPAKLPESQLQVESRENFFTYDPPAPGSSAVEWHLNFAHYDLFCAYSSPLLAQDELQVAEHPALASLREALLAADIPPLCVEDEQPTPALITGVERRIRLAIEPNAALGRPVGLYGNRFAEADATAIHKAVHLLQPPTVSNLLAMEAPACGFGRYSRDEINYILNTAFTGFSAARIESTRADRPVPVVIHTGFWGCGAYGGNRLMMTLLQLLAARLARVDQLVFHTGDRAGTEAFQRATTTFASLLKAAGQPPTTLKLIEQIEDLGLEWGESDGN